MEGVDIRELIKKSDENLNYRCLVEATMDHKIAPDDPLTETILKGAQGIATDFWYYSGDWWRPAIGIRWDGRYVGGVDCVYIETCRTRERVKKPITEIKFVRDLNSKLILPDVNPLIVHPDQKTIDAYFVR